jgi:hypothetical protein
MAHDVISDVVFSVHQTLHGYADGHRQLGSSVSLSSRDLKTMLIMSDTSASGTSLGDVGYLTGYPLSDSKMYALARTWPAPEMPRPGCVWTHTVLIDFADLARLPDLASVAEVFRRPRLGEVENYGSRLAVGAGRIATTLISDELHFARRLLAGIYDHPQSKITVERSSTSNIDAVVLAVWGQQWPRLRRAFRFCTFSAADRSIESSQFDLQLLPTSDRSVRSRFPDAFDITGIQTPFDDWLDDAVSDLADPDTAGLRKFLWRIGGDVDSGRDAFRSLCSLHVLIKQFQTSPKAVNEAISLLEERLGTSHARVARNIVATEAIGKPDQLDAPAFDFLIRNLSLVDPDQLASHSGALGRAIWRRDIELFSRMLIGEAIERSVSDSGLQSLSLDELIEGAERHPKLSDAVLSRRPQVLTCPKFWANKLMPVDGAFRTLSEFKELKIAGVTAMIAADREDLASKVSAKVGSLEILRAIMALPSSFDKANLSAWLAAAASQPGAVAKFLVETKTLSHWLLSGIARAMEPDSVPNEVGVDPWLLGLRAVDTPTLAEDQLFTAFLFSRALGERSRNPTELLIASFEPIYTTARKNNLSDEAWQVLEHRLPWSFSWFVWDRCQRIRVALKDFLVGRRVPYDALPKIASNESIFGEVVETLSYSDTGRAYLKNVRQWMLEQHSQNYAAKIKIIESSIHGRFGFRDV